MAALHKKQSNVIPIIFISEKSSEALKSEIIRSVYWSFTKYPISHSPFKFIAGLSKKLGEVDSLTVDYDHSWGVFSYAVNTLNFASLSQQISSYIAYVSDDEHSKQDK